MKKFSFIIFHFSFIMLLAACSGSNRVNDALQSADKLMFVAPDSAVAILDSLDLTDASRAQRARHALLLTKSREKANIVVIDDSLITVAADYYHGSGDSLEVQSLFYRGVILGYRGDYSGALISLMEAADHAADNGDDFYRAMAYREQAAIYTDLYEFGQAALFGTKAVEAFTSAKRPYYAVWERVFVPQSLSYAGKKSEAFDSIKVLASDCLIQSNVPLKRTFLSVASNVCYNYNDFELSERYFNDFIDAGGVPSSKMLSQMAELSLSKEDISKAKEYYELAVDCQQNKSDSLAAEWILTNLLASDNDYREAYNHLFGLYKTVNKRANKLITHPYTALLNDYFSSEANQQASLRDKAELKVIVWISVSISLLLIILMIVYSYRNKLRKRELERELLIKDLSQLETQISEIYANKVDKPAVKPSENSFPVKLLKSICDWRNILYSGDEGARRFGDKVSDLMLDLSKGENLAALEKYIDDSCDNLMTLFREQAVNMSERQFKVAVFVFLGFSDSTIASLFHDSPLANPRQERYRIRKKLKENPTIDTDRFLKYF